MIRASLSVAFALTIASPVAAQTLNMMKSIDAPHYDAQRTTWGPSSDIVNMVQDTLVALDWDGRTSARGWTRVFEIESRNGTHCHPERSEGSHADSG
jgi:peptide/nickel transport system substrate-binding protein